MSRRFAIADGRTDETEDPVRGAARGSMTTRVDRQGGAPGHRPSSVHPVRAGSRSGQVSQGIIAVGWALA